MYNIKPSNLIVLNNFSLWYMGRKSIVWARPQLFDRNPISVYEDSYLTANIRISSDQAIFLLECRKSIYTIIKSCSEVSNCVGLYLSESIFKMIWQSYSQFRKIIFGCSEGKPKNCIKIQNPKFQFLDPKFFQNRHTLKKWPNQ